MRKTLWPPILIAASVLGLLMVATATASPAAQLTLTGIEPDTLVSQQGGGDQRLRQRLHHSDRRPSGWPRPAGYDVRQQRGTTGCRTARYSAGQL